MTTPINVQLLPSQSQVYIGLFDTDTKPQPVAGSWYIEANTKQVYLADGSNWNLTDIQPVFSIGTIGADNATLTSPSGAVVERPFTVVGNPVFYGQPAPTEQYLLGLMEYGKAIIAELRVMTLILQAGFGGIPDMDDPDKLRADVLYDDPTLFER
jgi:hypothetical protein